MTEYILAIDQGTTSSRAILFDREHRVCAVAQKEFPQHFPASGWVEHDPEDLWESVVATCRQAMEKAGATAADIAGIGITNQRETTVVWDRATGRPIHNAIVWQDRRTADLCDTLRRAGHESEARSRTGLLIDPYFAGTKLAWILERVEGARERAARGDLCFGTVDSFLLWRLTGGRVHATDATNASRTLLWNIHGGAWDGTMRGILGVPESMLPEVKDCAADFGTTLPELFGGPIRILGVAGDQQAACIGQACFEPGMIKSTYGTGCFALLNTGPQSVTSRNRLLTTVMMQLDGKRTYALEGSIFVAGAAVQWLRDAMGLITAAAETQGLAEQADDAQDVYLVPAFVGLGAPYWDAAARGAVFGLTRATGPREFARAALECVAYQTRDLLDAMRGDWGGHDFGASVLRCDGGMVASDWMMQFLADILDTPVDRPDTLETTALGAAYLAGYRAGFYPGPDEFAAQWRLDRRFEPSMAEPVRARKVGGWRDAVRRTLTTSSSGPERGGA